MWNPSLTTDDYHRYYANGFTVEYLSGSALPTVVYHETFVNRTTGINATISFLSDSGDIKSGTAKVPLLGFTPVSLGWVGLTKGPIFLFNPMSPDTKYKKVPVIDGIMGSYPLSSKKRRMINVNELLVALTTGTIQSMTSPAVLTPAILYTKLTDKGLYVWKNDWLFMRTDDIEALARTAPSDYKFNSSRLNKYVLNGGMYLLFYKEKLMAEFDATYLAINSLRIFGDRAGSSIPEFLETVFPKLFSGASFL